MRLKFSVITSANSLGIVAENCIPISVIEIIQPSAVMILHTFLQCWGQNNKSEIESTKTKILGK